MHGRKEEPPPVYAESLFPELNMNWAPLRSVRDERWKFIAAPRPELYDTQADPGERDNRHDLNASTAKALASALARLAGGGPGEMSRQQMDRATIDRLASLGYVGAGGGAAAAGPSKADPKDMIEAYNRLNTASRLVQARRLDEALPILQQALAQDPQNAFARQVLGNLHLERREYEKAIQNYRALLRAVPSNAQAHQWIALCELELGRPDRALLEAEAALAIDPKYPDARILRGSIFAGRRQYELAIAEFRAALQTDPAKFRIRLDLASVLVSAGRSQEARSEDRSNPAGGPGFRSRAGGPWRALTRRRSPRRGWRGASQGCGARPRRLGHPDQPRKDLRAPGQARRSGRRISPPARRRPGTFRTAVRGSRPRAGVAGGSPVGSDATTQRERSELDIRRPSDPE